MKMSCSRIAIVSGPIIIVAVALGQPTARRRRAHRLVVRHIHSNGLKLFCLFLHFSFLVSVHATGDTVVAFIVVFYVQYALFCLRDSTGGCFR